MVAKTIWKIAHVLHYRRMELRNSVDNFGNAKYVADGILDEYFTA